MGEIERKVDMLISGIVLPRKRTRRRVATIVTTVLIAMTLIAGASLISFYYKQTAENIDVKCAVTITDRSNVVHETPWEETITGEFVDFYATETVTIGTYTAALNADADHDVTLYIHVDVTETPVPVPPAVEGEGLTVVVYDITNSGYVDQIVLGPGTSVEFKIEVTAHEAINHTSTYGYNLIMDHINTP